MARKKPACKVPRMQRPAKDVANDTSINFDARAATKVATRFLDFKNMTANL
jgi:hypothetical protein